MTKIAVTDSNDRKKEAVVAGISSDSGARKKSTRKAVDARVAVPKPIKKITVSKVEKTPKVEKSTKAKKAVKKSAKAKIEKVETSTKSIEVKTAKKKTSKKEIAKENKKKAVAKALGKEAVVATAESPAKASAEEIFEQITTEVLSEKTTEKAEKKASKKKVAHSSAAASAVTHSNLQKSTTLSRRYVKRPANELEEGKVAEEVDAAVVEKAAEVAEATVEEAAEAVVEEVAAEPVEETKAEKTTEEVVEEAKAESETEEITEKSEVTEPAAAAEPVETVTVAKAETTKPTRTQLKAQRQAEKAARAQARLAEKRARAEREAQAKLAAEQARQAARQAAARAKQTTSAMPKLKAKQTDDDRALRSAMRTVATMGSTDDEEMHGKFRKERKGGRILLAMLCSAITVAALVAFVNLNMPDISVKVAAFQTGIDASYPNIIPRGYTLKNVSSDEDEQIIMNFENSEGKSFLMTEEKSTWDSNALLNNYVKKNMSSDYTTMREQGITIYVDGDSSAWVNGGILYKTKSYGKNLTKEQIRNLATSV